MTGTSSSVRMREAPSPAEMAAASLALTRAAAEADWRGPDAYDGLWWSWPAPLVGGRRRRQVFMQLHARSPWDIRKLYRRTHPLIPKALGIFASTALRAQALTDDEDGQAFASSALALLAEDHTAGEEAWGYHWDMQTRWSYYPAGSPNVVVTAFAGSALLESGEPRYVARTRGAAEWVLEELWVEPEGYFAYHPGSRVNIHNASLLGAWLVHIALPAGPETDARVRRAVERTLADQNPDGSWPYGDASNLSWVDSFHSGYVLTYLDRLRDVDPERIDAAVARGAQHYLSFFGAEGQAQLWAEKPFLEDAHAAGTGLTTLATLFRRALVDREILESVAQRTLTAGIRDGHAVFRRYRGWRTSVHYLRWCDAHVALGLTDAALALAGLDDPAPTGLRGRDRPPL